MLFCCVCHLIRWVFEEGYGATLYSRRLTPCGRRLMAPPGLTALGAKGSACDRLRLTGGLRALPSGGIKYRCAGEVGRLYIIEGASLYKTIQPPCGRGKQANLAPLEEMRSPFGGWRHHLARWEACHWIRGSRGSPMNPVPLPPPLRGGTIKLRYAVSCL